MCVYIYIYIDRIYTYVHIYIYSYMPNHVLDVFCVITNLYLQNYVYTNIRRVIFFL